MAIPINTCQAASEDLFITNQLPDPGTIQFFADATALTNVIVVDASMNQTQLQNAINANIIVAGATIQITVFNVIPDPNDPKLFILDFKVLVTVPSLVQLDHAEYIFITPGDGEDIDFPFVCNFPVPPNPRPRSGGGAGAYVAPAQICFNRKKDLFGRISDCPARRTIRGYEYELVYANDVMCCYRKIE